MLFEINHHQYKDAYEKINQLHNLILITMKEKIALVKLLDQLLFGNLFKANMQYKAMNQYLHQHVKRILEAISEEKN